MDTNELNDMNANVANHRAPIFNDNKALVLFSGGLDSSTLLAMAVRELGSQNVVALNIFYGQKHAREMESAKAICAHYDVPLRTLDVARIFEGSNSSLLSASGVDVPKDSYASQMETSANNLVSTYVPFRNGLFLSCAASIALSLECDVVAYGAHKDDWAEEAYPDCSQAFVDAMASAIREGTGENLSLVAPFVQWPKSRIVEEGIKLSVPYELTWSCYEGGKEPCGTCATCIDRARAFEKNGAIDPLAK